MKPGGFGMGNNEITDKSAEETNRVNKRSLSKIFPIQV
jgi:hypothetical protein